MLYISRPLSSAELKRYYRSEYTALANQMFSEESSNISPERADQQSTEEEYEEIRKCAGWDFTFSAPKTASVTALIGKDQRVQQAHRIAVNAAIKEAEKYVQARIPGLQKPQTTGNWVAAVFEHNTAAPLGCYPAPHLHTHVVVMNMTRDAKGIMREIQPYELFKIRSFLTAIYQSELAYNLRALGYELEFGPSHVPEIKGYTTDYLAAVNIRLPKEN